MRICILSDYEGINDEGMRNIAYHFFFELSKRHEVMDQCLIPRSGIIKSEFWQKIRKFNPEIIHFIPGSTLKTFIFVYALKKRFPGSKIVMSVPHAVLNPLTEKIVPFFRPHLVLTQSYISENLFKTLGFNTKFLPNGVDTVKFSPVKPEEKEQLREKYEIKSSDFIVLHVGHLTKERNLNSLMQIQKLNNVQVLIIASISAGCNDSNLYQNLEDSGCKVWHQYFEEINEIYTISDCYIFPTSDRKGCVEFPLSILEAMSCNLPVISTDFGGLIGEIFKNTPGLYLADGNDFVTPVEKIINEKEVVETREAVLPYSWENLSYNLESLYSEVLAE